MDQAAASVPLSVDLSVWTQCSVVTSGGGAKAWMLSVHHRVHQPGGRGRLSAGVRGSLFWGKKKVPSLNDDFDLFYTWIKVILISVLRPWVCVDRWRSEQKGTRSTSCFSSSSVVVVVVVSYVDSEPGQPEQSSWPLIRADQWWCPEFQTWWRWRRGSLFLFSRFYCKTICDRVFTEVWWKKTPK